MVRTNPLHRAGGNPFELDAGRHDDRFDRRGLIPVNVEHPACVVSDYLHSCFREPASAASLAGRTHHAVLPAADARFDLSRLGH